MTTRHAIALAAAGLTFCGVAALAPEPDPIPKRWELRIDPGPLRVTSIEVKGEPRAFAYLTYTVTNASGKDLLFAPSFEMSFGGPRPIRAGAEIPAEVTSAILDRINDPALQDQISIIGTLLNGEENARRGLVVWSCESLDPRKLVVYAAGFSGETATVELPSQADPAKKAKAVLRKTLMLTFAPGGEITGRGDKPIPVDESRWIMR